MIAVDNPNIIKTLSNNQLFKIPWIDYYKKYDYLRQVFFLNLFTIIFIIIISKPTVFTQKETSAHTRKSLIFQIT